MVQQNKKINKKISMTYQTLTFSNVPKCYFDIQGNQFTQITKRSRISTLINGKMCCIGVSFNADK